MFKHLKIQHLLQLQTASKVSVSQHLNYPYISASHPLISNATYASRPTNLSWKAVTYRILTHVLHLMKNGEKENLKESYWNNWVCDSEFAFISIENQINFSLSNRAIPIVHLS